MGAEFGAGFTANTNSFQRLHRHIVETERSFFTHLAELERRQALRRQHAPDADPPVTDSAETENPSIGCVSQPTPNLDVPEAPAARQAAASPDDGALPSQPPSSEFGFVPHTARRRPPHNRTRYIL